MKEFKETGWCKYIFIKYKSHFISMINKEYDINKNMAANIKTIKEKQRDLIYSLLIYDEAQKLKADGMDFDSMPNDEFKKRYGNWFLYDIGILKNKLEQENRG